MISKDDTLKVQWNYFPLRAFCVDLTLLGPKTIEIYSIETLTYDGKALSEAHLDLTSDLAPEEEVYSAYIINDTIFALVEKNSQEQSLLPYQTLLIHNTKSKSLARIDNYEGIFFKARV